MTPVELVLSKLPGAKPSGSGWAARCPAHEDRKPSLSVSEGEDGRALAHCHAGCETDVVCAALGLTLADLMPPRHDPQVLFGTRPVNDPRGTTATSADGRGRKRSSEPLPPKPSGIVYATANDAVKALTNRHGPPAAMWTYHDANGRPVGVVVRWDRDDGKDIRPVARFPDGWRIAAMPDPRPLYALPQLAEVRSVLVVEGELCAEAARALGLTATTSSGGAKAATKTDWSPLAGKEVWVLPDHDAPGRKYAGDVVEMLAALSPRPVVKVLDPQTVFGRADLPKGHDLADALAECATDDDRSRLRATLEAAARQAPPSAGNRAQKSDAGGWPIPASLPSMPDVPPFPLHIFPAKVAEYWRAAGEALVCPVDYVAVPGLSLLGAAIGRSRAAEVKPGYAESPLFWTATFAPPGGTKSPALRAARAPLQQAEARWLDEHRERLSIFDVEMDRFNQSMKEWKSNGCKGEPPTKPRRPTLRQATLDDATTEATAKVLADNPRGVVMVKDEMMAFIRGMNQYKTGGKGADREFWLSAWAGAPAKTNRSGTHETGPLVVQHPFVAVAGMLCPDSLPELRGEGRTGTAPADGFLDRFLLSFPDPMDATPELWRTIPEEVQQGYCDVFLDLLGLEMVTVEDSPTSVRQRPYFVRFSDSGRVAWEEFTGTLAERMNALEKFDPFRGVLSKLRGYGARFACLLWCLRRACNELEPNAMIDSDILYGASVLVDYFEAHAARCMGRGWADLSIRVATRLLRWLQRNPDRPHFTRTHAFLALKDRRDVRSADMLAPAFKVLVDHGYLRPLDRPENVKPGPVPETYLVNPLWLRTTESDPANPYS